LDSHLYIEKSKLKEDIIMQTNFKTQYRTIVHAPLHRVWEAITKPELVKQYFFGTDLLTNWAVGSDIIFNGDFQGQKYQDIGKILEYVEYEKLAYSYLSSFSGKEDKPENYLWICYEVMQIEDGTELTITQSNYDEERAKHSEANWSMVVDGLKKIVE
jgi:uncharacterized protein YndB with AHSA1/START domain